MNYFDPKSVLLAKHAQHVVLIHFPIALFLTGVLFDFAGLRKPRPTLAAAAFANLMAAAISVPFVLTSGILAWRWQLEGQRLHGLLLFHLVLGCLTGLLIVAVAAIHFRARKAPSLPTYRLPLELLATLAVIATGHLGGFLSGVNIPS